MIKIEYDNAITKSFDYLNEKQKDKYVDNSRYTIPINKLSTVVLLIESS